MAVLSEEDDEEDDVALSTDTETEVGVGVLGDSVLAEELSHDSGVRSFWFSTALVF